MCYVTRYKILISMISKNIACKDEINCIDTANKIT